MRTQAGGRVLFFTPYGDWRVHNQVDVLAAAALRSRGHEIYYLACNGLYQPCAITRDAQNCAGCMASMHESLSQFDVPYASIGEWLNSEDISAADLWAAGLSQNEFSNARYDNLPIGAWSISTVLTHFRVSSIEQLQHPRIAAVHRRFLRDTLCTFIAIDRVLAAEQYAAMLLFNGRFYPYRAALEAGRRRNVRVLTHERGRTDNSFVFFESESIFESKTATKLASSWANVPLSQGEIERVKGYFSNMLAGVNSHWPAFYSNISPIDPYRSLDVPRGARLIGFFTSSSDEFAFQPGFGDVTKQYKLIDDIGRHLEGTDTYLVVRHHPNFAASERAPTELSDFIRAYQQAFKRFTNVRIVMPRDDLSSYALFPYLTAAVAPISSIGAELTAFGIPTVVSDVSEGRFDDRFILSDWSFSGVVSAIEFLLSPSAALGIDEFRKFYRRVYSVIFRFSVEFRSIGIKDYFIPVSHIKDTEGLLPNRDPMLDRICDYLLEAAPVHPRPGIQEELRASEDEQQFLHEQVALAKSRRESLCSGLPVESDNSGRFETFSIIVDEVIPGHMSIERWLQLPHGRKMHIRPLRPQSYIQRLLDAFRRKRPSYPGSEFEIWRKNLLRALRKVGSGFVLITSPRFQFHDISISAISDAVAKAKCERAPVVPLSGWLLSGGDLSIKHMSPARIAIEDWIALKDVPTSSLRLWDAISLVLVDRDKLEAELRSMSTSPSSDVKFAGAVFDFVHALEAGERSGQPVFLLE